MLVICDSERDRRNSYAKCVNFGEMRLGDVHLRPLWIFLRGPFFVCFICSSQWCLRHLKLPDKWPSDKRSHWTDCSSKVRKRIRSIYCPTGSWRQLQEQVATPFKFNSSITVATLTFSEWSQGRLPRWRCCVSTRRGRRQLLKLLRGGPGRECSVCKE